MKESQFEADVKDFFSSTNKSELLVINSDLLYDSKNRINMCRTHINNARPEKDKAGPHPKHVVFVVRVDQSKGEQAISFGRNWR